VRRLITPDDERRFAVRAQRCAEISAKRRTDIADAAKSRAGKIPIDPQWLSYRIAKILDDNCIVFDETIAQNQLHDYLGISQPGAYFHNPASSGGWAQGAAFGAKMAAPGKDVIAVSGDGFYMFGTPIHALWAARHYKAPFMAVVYQNRSYSTGTLRIDRVYGKDQSYAAKADYDGGYFDPPIDFAKEAEAAGAYGELVTDPGEVDHALRRGLKAIREEGRPAVISVWLARLLQKD
jgi:acetolactate synthase-1/2/3 large subunit